jgi:hypothetical protein
VAYAHYVAGEVRLKRWPDEALSHLRRAVHIARGVGDRFTAAAAGLSATSMEVRRGDPNAAPADLIEVLDEWHRAGSWSPTWLTLLLCFDVFVRLGEHEVAAQLLGAMHASTTARPVCGADAERLAGVEATLESRLGNASYEALAARGATLSDDGAVALARRTLSGLVRSTA